MQNHNKRDRYVGAALTASVIDLTRNRELRDRAFRNGQQLAMSINEIAATRLANLNVGIVFRRSTSSASASPVACRTALHEFARGCNDAESSRVRAAGRPAAFLRRDMLLPYAMPALATAISLGASKSDSIGSDTEFCSPAASNGYPRMSVRFGRRCR